jgi:hypothetical protein
MVCESESSAELSPPELRTENWSKGIIIKSNEDLAPVVLRFTIVLLSSNCGRIQACLDLRVTTSFYRTNLAVSHPRLS